MLETEIVADNTNVPLNYILKGKYLPSYLNALYLISYSYRVLVLCSHNRAVREASREVFTS